MYARHALGVFAVAALCVGRPASAHTLTSTLSGLVAPKLLRDAAPDYPPAALADGVAGTLHALLELSVTGTVTAVHLQNSLREDLDLAAIIRRASSGWTYAPEVSAKTGGTEDAPYRGMNILVRVTNPEDA